MTFFEVFKSPDELINEIEKFSNYRLQKKQDLLKLIKISLDQNQIKNFEDLVFTAKYVRGLMKVLSKSTNTSDIPNINEIKSDLSEKLSKVKEQIKTLLDFSDDDTKIYFEEEYFNLTQESFGKLNNLLSDLEWTKMFLNQVKRGKN